MEYRDRVFLIYTYGQQAHILDGVACRIRICIFVDWHK